MRRKKENEKKKADNLKEMEKIKENWCRTGLKVIRTKILKEMKKIEEGENERKT